MAVNRNNRRSPLAGLSLLNRGELRRTGGPTPIPTTRPATSPASTRNGGRAPVLPVRTSRPTGGESPVRTSRPSTTAVIKELQKTPTRTVADIIQDSNKAITSVISKDPIPAKIISEPSFPPFPTPAGRVSILGTVDPTALLKDNQQGCPDATETESMEDKIKELIDHINSIKDDIANIEIPILGCTDPNALNFNPSANKETGRCEYPEAEVEEEEDFTEALVEPEPPEVKVCAADYQPSEQNLEAAKRQMMREDIGGELESEMKNIWDEQVVEFPIEINKDSPQYAASKKLKTELQRNDLGILLLRGKETAKLNISLNRRFFDASKYREVIDTIPSALVGRIKSGK